MGPFLRLAALVLLAPRFASSDEGCDADDPACVVVVCCGDSITAGGHGGARWPELLQAELGKRYKIVNQGQSGPASCIRDDFREILTGKPMKNRYRRMW